MHEFAIKNYQSNDYIWTEDPALADKKLLDRTNISLVSAFRDWVDCITQQAFDRGRTQLKPDLANCGGVFADFLGVIFSLKLSSGGLVKATRPKPPRNHSISLSAQVTGKFESEKIHSVLDAIWPIIRGINRRKEQEKRFGKPEYTVSVFQHTGAIYISSLGRLVPGNSRHEPVIYALVVPYTSKYSLGRVVDRLHSLGTLRLAALRDLNKINRSSNNINKLFQMITNYKTTNLELEDLSNIVVALSRLPVQSHPEITQSAYQHRLQVNLNQKKFIQFWMQFGQ